MIRGTCALHPHVADRRDVGCNRFRSGNKGVQAPDVFQPWSSDDQIVALITWAKGNPIYLYHVESRSHIRVQSGTAFLCSVQFDPDSDRLLISFSDSSTVCDRHGVKQFTVTNQMADPQAPFVSWLPGTRFLWIGRERAGSGTVLRIYSGLDGTLLETQPLEPDDAVPYDRHRYENVSRDLSFGGSRGRPAATICAIAPRSSSRAIPDSRFSAVVEMVTEVTL